MGPLLILIPFLTAASYAKPGGLYSYPAPTPSAAPAVQSNLVTPSPSIAPTFFNLPAHRAPLAPHIYNLPAPTASPAPSIINFPAPVQSYAPPSFVNNLGAGGQYASPFINNGASFGIPSIRLGNQPYGFGFQQPQFNFGFGDQDINYGQSGINFGEQLFGGGFPQLFGSAPQQSPLAQAPPKAVAYNPAPLNVQPTAATASFGFNKPNVAALQQLPVISPSSAPPSAVAFNPAPLKVEPTAATAGSGFNGPNLQSTGGAVSTQQQQPVISSLSGPQLAGDFNLAQLHVGPTAVTTNFGFTGPNLQSVGGVFVQKHVYFHVAPEDLEERAPPRQIVIPPPRKHYRIIFIKAPSAPIPPPPVIPPQPQDEERTLVYVLVKRPEEPEVKIQTPPPPTSTKPEVYFIRYNSGKESTASGSVATSPVSIQSGNNNPPLVEDRSNDASVSTYTVNSINDDQEPNKDVALNLNRASLSGGSALSLAVTGSAIDNNLEATSPSPQYGVPGQN